MPGLDFRGKNSSRGNLQSTQTGTSAYQPNICIMENLAQLLGQATPKKDIIRKERATPPASPEMQKEIVELFGDKMMM